MKNYVVFDYQNWADLSADLTAELNELINNPVSAVHKKYGECKVSCFIVSINESNFNILADFAFTDETKKLALNILLKNGLVQIDDYDSFEVLKNFISSLTDLQAEVHNIQYDRTSAKQEADRQAKELAKQEAKRLSHREKSIQEFERMTRVDRGICATGEFYYNLGWLAKNVGTISVSLPDYLLPYFENHFGTEAKPTVIDSSKRTVNGHPMQWTFSMKASLHKNSLSTIPALLKQYLSSAGNSLTYTEFIWDIVENYGFKFGKTQDLEKIRESIPVHCLEYFEKGYAE
jgi:hypothetical protein